MRVTFFGTFDERSHPRVRALREGIEQGGHAVHVINMPLDLDTAARVSIAQRPWRAPILGIRLARCWFRLWRAGAGQHPDIVVVGYLGHFDVHLARRRFPGSTIVLDHMVSLGDTARDRGLGARSMVARVLDAVDRRALRAADVVVVDTAAQGAALPCEPRRVCVVPVAPPRPWFEVTPAPAPGATDPVRIVFFGLFTPLQGAPVLGAALGRLPDDLPIEITMIGAGQDLAETQALTGADPRVTWIDWVDAADLPDVVATHHVCLGIFGTTPKATRVVPNKVLQGAAAGCAVITGGTPVQREALDGAAEYVEPGSVAGLTSALVSVVTHREALAEQRERARALAVERFSPLVAVAPLLAVLDALGDSARMHP